MRWTFSLLVVFVAATWRPAAANELVVISLMALQSEVEAGSSPADLPIRRLTAFLVAEEGDLMLVGRRSPLSGLSVDDIALTLRAVLNSSQPQGVRAIPDFAPGTGRLRLVYAGDAKDTTVGAVLSEGLAELMSVSRGIGVLPPGFWSYPPAGGVKLRVFPAQGRCDRLPNPNIIIAEEPRITIDPEHDADDGVAQDVDDWIRLILEEYHALGETRPDLVRLGNILALYRALSLAETRLRYSDWGYFLSRYRAAEKRTRRWLEVGPAQAVFSAIAFEIPKDMPCEIDKSLSGSKSVDEILRGRNTSAYPIVSAQKYPELAAVEDPRLSSVEDEIKTLGFLGRSVFANLRLSVFPPRLQILWNRRISTRATAHAREAKGLVLQAVSANGPGASWATFYAENIEAFLASRREGHPLIGLISDKVTADWVGLDAKGGLTEQGLLFPTLDARDEPVEAALRVLRKLAAIPRMNDANISIVVGATPSGELPWFEKLERTLGKERVLLAPSSSELLEFLQEPHRHVILFEGQFRRGEVVVRDGAVRYDAILALRRLDHVRFLAFGAFGYVQNRRWDRDVIRALQAKGVGVVSITRSKAPSASTRIDTLLRLFQNGEFPPVRAFLLPVVLAPSGGTTYWERMP